ncbi:MAG: phosphonate C-P lyase system protein PhnG [Candidatus Muproteobacteria bacterium RBG_16_64_11]|uniref:Phosphonate C-P lyase system protein PhnG n=1 Tax=Candidatus Muproteobacteria bacterium RBG_16_64_11 TaxID=1817758 RepID=A0A1F6TFT8_9PROT|nr:MAG: phosphonate C-P lyase system protein PhnG [Candidatus Muproteobacteria bacterium RBG_16_64_11]
MDKDSQNIARSDWACVLAALPAGEIKAAADAIARTHEVHDVSLPQAGLGLLTLRDGAFHEPFYLGEVPVARAHVVVRTHDGHEASGGAVLIDDRARLARALAILDATLAARLPGWEAAAALVERGVAVRAQRDAQRLRILDRTRVDFALLGQTEEEEDDE